MESNQSTRRHLLGLGATTAGALTLSRIAHAQGASAPAPAAPTPVPTATSVPTPTPTMGPSSSDLELLRSALLVEQVGMVYYSQVLGAQNGRSYLTPKVVAAVTQMAQTKAAHVTAISDVLGGGGITPTFKFPRPSFISPVAMPWLGYTLEELAIGAHLHAMSTLGSKTLRSAVAGIIGADSGHAALLRTVSGTSFSPRFFEAKLMPEQVTMYLNEYLA